MFGNDYFIAKIDDKFHAFPVSGLTAISSKIEIMRSGNFNEEIFLKWAKDNYTYCRNNILRDSTLFDKLKNAVAFAESDGDMIMYQDSDDEIFVHYDGSFLSFRSYCQK